MPSSTTSKKRPPGAGGGQRQTSEHGLQSDGDAGGILPRGVVAPRQPPAGEFPQRHRRFAVHAQTFDVARLQRLVVFFLRLSKMASVSLSFFRGLALTTLRNR